MITGAHTVIHSRDAEADRAFFRDVLSLPSVDAGGGWLVQQRDLTPEWLANLLRTVDRKELIRRAEAAKKMQKIQATEEVVAACEELAQ